MQRGDFIQHGNGRGGFIQNAIHDARSGSMMRCCTCSSLYLQCPESCESCTTKALEKQAEVEKKAEVKKRAEFEKLQAKITFLSHQYGKGPPGGILEGTAVIIVQGRTDEPLLVEKYVLSSKSSVFCKMFDSKMREKDTGMVRIDDATLPVIRAMIKFCYVGEIDFTLEVTAEEVLEVAHKYDIAYLQRICEEQLITTITNANLPKMLKMAEKFQATILQANAWKHFKRNFDTVIADVMHDYG